MHYMELREAMDHDAEDLKRFAVVLERELSIATDELATALSQEDTQKIADLKHKLKTSLQLLEAHRVRDQMQAITDDLRSGRPVAPNRKTELLQQLRQLGRDLSRERW